MAAAGVQALPGKLRDLHGKDRQADPLACAGRQKEKPGRPGRPEAADQAGGQGPGGGPLCGQALRGGLPAAEDAEAGLRGSLPGADGRGVQEGAQEAAEAPGRAAQHHLPQEDPRDPLLRGLGRRRQGRQHPPHRPAPGSPGLRRDAHRLPRAPRAGPPVPLALLDQAAPQRPHLHLRPHLVRPGHGGAAGGLLQRGRLEARLQRDQRV